MNKPNLYNLGQKFHLIAKENANNIAIYPTKGMGITYQEIDMLSNKLANYLLEKGLEQNDVIAILNNKSFVSYSLMIACLKIGVIYTNLDPKSPLERFNRMIDTCGPKILFYFEDEKSIINKFDSSSIRKIDYSSNLILELIDKYPTNLISDLDLISPKTPAYIMFTSGSTGFPKGVAISHQNVLNFIQWSKKTYHTTSNDIFTNINPMHFDNSVFDFYSSFFTGASIIPINENLTRNPRKLLDALNDLKPTIWFSVPSMLVYVLNMRALNSSDLSSLKTVTFGGEGFPKNQLRKLWGFWGHRVRFVNVYGPTECTCICSYYVVSEKDMESDELLPLGHMAPNFYGLVIDSEGKEVANAEIGELHIGGENVGLGYFNNKEKTEEVFISNKIKDSFNEIVYKSGDLVRQDPITKMFMFSGRIDNQIKRMGYRIELEEIENAFNAINFVKEAAVVYLDNDAYNSKIIACLNSTKKDENKISEILKKYLPSYMIPDLYFYFGQLPKNQNGKIDRLELKNLINR